MEIQYILPCDQNPEAMCGIDLCARALVNYMDFVAEGKSVPDWVHVVDNLGAYIHLKNAGFDDGFIRNHLADAYEYAVLFVLRKDDAVVCSLCCADDLLAEAYIRMAHLPVEHALDDIPEPLRTCYTRKPALGNAIKTFLFMAHIMVAAPLKQILYGCDAMASVPYPDDPVKRAVLCALGEMLGGELHEDHLSIHERTAADLTLVFHRIIDFGEIIIADARKHGAILIPDEKLREGLLPHLMMQLQSVHSNLMPCLYLARQVCSLRRSTWRTLQEIGENADIIVTMENATPGEDHTQVRYMSPSKKDAPVS